MASRCLRSWRELIVVVATACTPHVPEKPKPRAPVDAVALVEATPGLRLPDEVAPLAYDLRLELDPDSARFRGEVTIRVKLDKAASRIWLHAVGLDLESATFGAGERLQPIAEAGEEMRGFAFGRVVPAGEIVLAFRYTGDVGAEEEGLFREKSSDGDWLLYSQSESVFARKIVPCFDEPRWKVPWRVTLVVPVQDAAFANAAEAGRDPLADQRVAIRFVETPPMPSYLLAVAVGKFAIVDGGKVGKDHVPLRVIVPVGFGASDIVQRSIATTKLLVPKLEAYFASPLPWPKLDLVAVPHLFGAMENPGLITFDAPYLRDETGEHRSFARVAGHELAHLWFGDWVTFAWWDDLWLAESFASWMGDKVATEIGDFPDAANERLRLRHRALVADDDVDAKALQRPITSGHDPESRFDAISYDKGQAVLEMFERFIGEDRFRGAIRDYLGAHRGGIATTADLIAALAHASDGKTAQALADVISHPGAPIVDFACRDGALVASARIASVPVCVGMPTGNDVCAIVGTTPAAITSPCPDSIVGNASAAGYFHVAPGPLVAFARRYTSDELAARGDDVAFAFARGELTVRATVDELAALAALRSPLGMFAIIEMLDPLVEDARRARWVAWISGHVAWMPSGPIVAALRKPLDELGVHAPASVAGSRKQLADHLRALGKVKDPRAFDIVLALFPDAAIVPDPDAATLAVLRRALATAGRGEREVVLANLATGPVAIAGDVVVAAARQPPLMPPILALLERGATRTSAWAALRPMVSDVAARISPEDVVDLIDATGTLCTPTAHAEVQAAFAPVAGVAPDGVAALAHALATIDRCVKRAAAAGSDWP